MQMRINFDCYRDSKPQDEFKVRLVGQEAQTEFETQALLDYTKEGKKASLMQDYKDLFEQERRITQKRTQMLKEIKDDFEEFSRDKYPEYLL